MNKTPDFSIVITIYNLETYIGKCIESVQSQKNMSFEIICVDDCSTDNSWGIMESYARNDARIRLLKTEQNGGLATARNLGFKAAVGKYVYNIDGDDILAENALETMHEYMDNNRLDMLSFSAISFFDDDELRKFGTEDEYLRKNDYPGVWNGKKLFAELVKNDERINGNMVLYCFNNTFIKENNLYLTEGLRYGDDRMFSFFMYAQRVMCINTPLYRRRYRVGSAVTSEKKRIYLESLIVGLGSDLIIWMQSRNDEEVDHQIMRYFDGRLREIDKLEKLFKNDTSEMKYLSKFPATKYMYDILYKKKSVYEEIIDANTLNKIKDAKKLYVYGTGDIADKVTEYLEFHGVFDFEYVITKNTEDYHLNRRVYCIDDVNPSTRAKFVIATSLKYRDEIESILQERGFSEYYPINKEL